MEIRVEVRHGLSDEEVVGVGVMTDEHPQSSYGIPVFVSDRDGQVYGSGDYPLSECSVHILDQDGDQVGWNIPVETWLRSAGYHIAFEQPQ